MPRALRTFFQEMDKFDESWYLEISEPVDPSKFEVSALAKNLEDAGTEKALHFTNVTNLLGQKSDISLLINTFAQRSYCAVALGLEPDQHRMELVEQFTKLKSTPGEIEVISASDAPCREVVWSGEELDLRRLPVPMMHEKDAGPYFTMANIMKSRNSDFYDISCVKNMIHEPLLMSSSANPRLNIRHMRRLILEYEEAGEPAPVVLVQGHHPAFYLGGQAFMPYGNNDYFSVAGYMREPLRLTPSVTWGDSFLVPADSELIIEGEIMPGIKRKQNPFGEFSGHYQAERMAPVIKVRAVYHRRNAIMQAIFPGHPDHLNLGGVSREGNVFDAVKRVVPAVTAVHLPYSGTSRFTCNIAIKKISEADARRVAWAALTALEDLKIINVVDHDIDVFNEREVQWSVVMHARPHQDVVIIPEAQSFRPWLGSSIMIIDATKPDDPNFPERMFIPQDALAKMDLKKYTGNNNGGG